MEIAVFRSKTCLANRNRRRLGISMLGMAMGVHVAAQGNDRDLQREIDGLREEIANFRGFDRQQVIEQERLAEIRALVVDVVSDAERRTSFQEADQISSWKEGFRIGSPDGSFMLEAGGQLQIRYVLNRVENADPEYLNGFENRRTRLNLRGHVVDPRWTYRIRTNFFVGNGRANVDEAWIARDLGDGWEFKVGQFKPPFLREQLVPDSRLLAAERSVVSLNFDQLRSQGMQLSWTGESDRLAAWTGDGLPGPAFGAARANGFNTAWTESNAWYSVVARGEHRFAGSWEQLDDFNSPRGSDFAAMVGLAGLVQRARDSAIGVNDAMVTSVTADLTLAFSGASLFASGVWAHETVPGGPSANPWGVTVQGGVFVLDDVELFGLYEYLLYDPTRRTGSTEGGRYNGITVGGNWFLNPATKLTLDWSMNFSSLSYGSQIVALAGMRVDSPDESGQWALRAQMQLLF